MKLLTYSLVLMMPVGLLWSSHHQPATTTAKGPKTDTVVIKRMKFHPQKLVVHKGDVIVFINEGFVDHDVTEKDKKWASPRLKPKDVYKMTAKKSFHYFCSIHVVMKGQVIVK